MLRIETDSGCFELAENFSLQVEDTSPVMNDRGPQTLPATVPATPHNARLMGFPFRLDSDVDLTADMKRVTVADGVYFRRGMANMVSASRRDGISFNIGFDNAEAYARWKNRKLQDLDNLPVVEFADGMAGLREYLKKVERGGDYDISLFKVMIEKDDKYPVYLNRYPFSLVESAVTMEIDGKETRVSVPPGYGISPFVHVWRVLELVFADLGVKVVSNPLYAEPELRRLVVLNNCTDACCVGKILYKDLMPSCTVESFLNALRVRFGLVYLIDFNKNEVELKLIRDIIRDGAGMDLSSVLTDYPTISFDSPKYVVLSAATSFEGAAPSTERFEDFIKDVDLSSVTSAPTLESAMKTSLVYTTLTGEWFKWDKLNDEYVSSGSSFFNWNPQTDGIDAESMSSEDEFVPVIKTDNGYTPCFLAGSSHRHSYIKGYKQETPDTPLAFLFAFSGVQSTAALSGFGQTFGSWTPSLPDGTNVVFEDGSTHNLTLLFQFANGLFANFWREYDEVLRHGFRTVEFPVSMPMHKLSGIDVLKPVLLSGQRLLVDSFSYSLPGTAWLPVTFKTRTLRPVGDYDLDAEQKIPDFGPGIARLQWRYVADDMIESAESLYDDIVNTYNGLHGTDCNVAVLKNGYPSTVGFTVWQTDEELFALQPETDGEELVRFYRCKAVYMVGRTEEPDDDGYVPPTKWVGEWEQTVTYKVRLVGSKVAN